MEAHLQVSYMYMCTRIIKIATLLNQTVFYQNVHVPGKGREKYRLAKPSRVSNSLECCDVKV